MNRNGLSEDPKQRNSKEKMEVNKPKSVQDLNLVRSALYSGVYVLSRNKKKKNERLTK